MRINKLFGLILILIILVSINSSCKKQLEVDPPIYTANEGTIYNSDEQAVAVLSGIYTQMSSGNLWNLSLYPGLSADELVPSSSVPNLADPNAFYKNALTTSNVSVNYWGLLYPLVYYSNVAMDGLSKSSFLTPAVKKQLSAEARLIRAFSYFYLVNLYGDVPLITSTDYNVNRVLSKTSKDKIWEFIIDDLKIAKDSLSADYLNGTLTAVSENRVRATKWVATALLARAYLYTENFAAAESEATTIIDNATLFSLPAPNEVFLATSPEAIWQWQPVNSGQNTQDARVFVLSASGFSATRPFYVSDSLLNQFEPGDQRFNSWLNSRTFNGTKYYYPFKYKVSQFGQPVTEYTMIFRLAEQLLIRAEARVHLNNVSGAIEDINLIRSRARATATIDIPDPLPELSSLLTSEQALDAIYHERQIEFFTEFGHRWLDLKRTGLVNTVMVHVSEDKGGTWNPNWAYYPIPASEITRDPNLRQNDGYN
jgi:starch-binding outer membrane protein, SusD/RagB family